MLLLVVYTVVLRLIDAGSGSSSEENRKAVTASFNAFQSNQELAPSESAQCPICGLCFRNLAVHMSIHNHQKPFRCTQCDKQYTKATDLRRHQRMHSGENLHNCSTCGKQFTRLDMLERHQQMHSGVKSFLCAECGKQFGYACSLRSHQRTHTGEKPFVCTECGKQFARAHNLRTHQRTHTGEKQFSCNECGKKFARLNNLRRHQRPYAGVTTECDMYSHQRTRTPKERFICLKCGENFTIACSLLIHQFTHVGKKPIHCTECGKHFARSDNLLRHQRLHMDANTFNCSSRGMQIVRDGDIGTHEKRDYLRNQQFKQRANLENFIGYSSSENTQTSNSLVESLPPFHTILQHSSHRMPLFQLENFTFSNDSSFTRSKPVNLDDSASFGEITNLTVMENPLPLYPALGIPMDDASAVEMKVSGAERNPFLFQNALKKPVDRSPLTQMDNPTEPVNPFLLHVDNPGNPMNKSPSVNPVGSTYLFQPLHRTVSGNPFLFQNPMDNPSLADTEGNTALQTLIDILSLIQADTHDITNASGSVPDAQLPSGDSDAISGSTCSECPVCFGRFGGRETLKDHLLNSSCSLFPFDWLSYLGSGCNTGDTN